MEIVVRTEELPASDRFGYWHDTLKRSVLSVDVRSDDEHDFRAEIRLLDLGDVQISAHRHPRLRAWRSARAVQGSDPDWLFVSVIRHGTIGFAQCRRQITLRRGDLVLHDSSHAFESRSLPGDGATSCLVHVVRLPRALMPLPAKTVESFTCTALPTARGTAAVAARYLDELITQAPHHRPGDAPRLATVTVDLVATAFTRLLGDETGLGAESRNRALMAHVDDFIRRHLGDPDLSPQTVAAAHHVSVRTLHRSFEARGTTIAALIRTLRLERCFDDLTDPRQGRRLIGTIAARWGFRDAAAFSRAFYTAYGITPTECRAARNAQLRTAGLRTAGPRTAPGPAAGRRPGPARIAG